MKNKGLRRKTIRKKRGSKAPEYIIPFRKEKGSSHRHSKDYEYFHGHILPEIAKQLPNKCVVCWYNDHILSLPICALNKFWKEKNYCKRCSLFQSDRHAQEIRSLIGEWELDDLWEE